MNNETCKTMWIFWIILTVSVTVTAMLWSSGIEYMKENHPEYKGEDLFDEEEKQEGWGEYVDGK